MERRVALSTGVSLALEEHGEGTPVVLLHAWGEGRGSFERLVPLLPRTARVVVPDLRGSGDSDKPPQGYSLVAAAADVVALLDELGLDSAVLVGTSSGGYVAQQVAVSAPGRVSGLVLVGSPRSLRGIGDPFGSLLADLGDPVTLADVVALTEGIPLHAELPAGFLDRRVQEGLRIPAHVWLRGYEGLLAAEPPTDTGRIVAPTLVLWGSADELLPREDMEDLCRAVPGSELRVYDGTGHAVLWEQPERVAADIRAFLAGRLG